MVCPNFLEKKEMLLTDMRKCIHKSIDDKAILSLKYDSLNSKNNFIQISVIVMSTLITFTETLKASYSINQYFSMLAPIIISTYIGLVIAIIRFLKYDERRETISKTLERFTYIINKYKKTKHEVKNFDYCSETENKWDNLINIYQTETYDYLITTREMFDNIFSFKDLQYYRRKLKYLHIDALFNDKDEGNLENIKNHREYIKRMSFCQLLSTKLCCVFKTKDYNKLLDAIVKEKKDAETETEPFQEKGEESHTDSYTDTDNTSNNNLKFVVSEL